MTLEELINNNYNKLTKNELNIYQFILNNRELCEEISSENLANECYISRTTLLRFCRKLGLNSFAELKYILKLKSKKTDKQESIDIKKACSIYHNTIDEIKERNYDDICKLIYNSKIIYIYGTGNAQKAEAEEFKRIFLSAGKCVIDLFDLGEIEFAKTKFTDNDLFVILSLSGETVEGINILKSIETTSINVLSITRFQNNSIARMCKNNLYVGTKMLYGMKNLSYEITAAFYVLIDMLFVNYIEYIRGLNK